jgi:hypothetical protein
MILSVSFPFFLLILLMDLFKFFPSEYAVPENLQREGHLDAA